jgi:hypothetical protein
VRARQRAIVNNCTAVGGCTVKLKIARYALCMAVSYNSNLLNFHVLPSLCNLQKVEFFAT